MKTICDVLAILAVLVLLVGSWFTLNVGKMYAADYLLLAITLVCISHILRPEGKIDGQDSQKEPTVPGL